MSVVLLGEDGTRFFVKDTAKDFHTKFGYFRSISLNSASPGTSVVSSKGKPYVVVEPSFLDLYSKIERAAQIPLLKDLGAIIAHCGIGKNSVIVDAGSGSGGISCFLAKIAKKVVTYDINKDAVELVKSNKRFFELANLTVKEGDITEGIPEKNVDVVILDLPEPWAALETVKKTLRPGGYLVTYSPNLSQVQQTVVSLNLQGFVLQKILEEIERQWIVDSRRIKPGSTLHSGFILIARRI